MELDLAGLSFRKSERYKKRFRRALPGPGEPLAEDLLCARGERRLAPGVRDLLHDLRLGRIGVNRAGDGLQAQARIHEHRELIDHVARMVSTMVAPSIWSVPFLTCARAKPSSS